MLGTAVRGMSVPLLPAQRPHRDCCHHAALRSVCPVGPVPYPGLRGSSQVPLSLQSNFI